MKDIEDLLSRYWALAYHEGKTGESRGDEANEVLFELRAAVEADRAQRVPEDSDLWCEYVAEMVGAYIKEPVGSEKVKAIAGIIRRRMPTRFFASTPAQPAQQDHKLCKHCHGAGFTEKAGYQIPCLCQLSAEELEKVLSELIPQPVERTVIGYVPISAVEETPLDGYMPVYASEPRQERKPMTDEVVREGFASCGVGGINARLGFVEGVKFTERHYGIRE